LLVAGQSVELLWLLALTFNLESEGRKYYSFPPSGLERKNRNAGTIMRGSRLFASFALLSGTALSFSLPVRTSPRTTTNGIRGEQGIATGRSNTALAWGGSAATSPNAVQHEHEKVDDEVEAIGIHIPAGLRQTLIANAHDTIAKRFWIIDNSGSMILSDGHLTSVDHGIHHHHHDDDDDTAAASADSSSCFTRWDEVSETVRCHTQLASALTAPTEFRLLNPPKHGGPLIRGPQRFRVGYGLNRKKQAVKDCRHANSIMLRNAPSGRTPIAATIRDIRRDVVQMLPQLGEDGNGKKKVCIVIATDGCNYNAQNAGLEVNEEERNREMVEALESLRDLPVCVVVRLCTDHEPVVDFYNGLDESLVGVDIDVLDDHVAEADEVNEHNPWLNYALVLHRMREMGQDCRLFDLLDERPFTRDEVRDFCVVLFGDEELRYDGDWDSFVGKVDRLQRKERKHWNPITKTLTPWINTSRLASLED